jgi:hypothetical protein
MATSCYAGESAFTVLLKILKIVSLLVSRRNFSSRSRIERVEEYAIECSVLKVV